MSDPLPEASGLAPAGPEHDSCGVGFVADLGGRKTHTILKQALGALVNLQHRGAVSADGLTGDGVGVLTQIPHALFQKELAARGVRLGRAEDLAVGVIFLPPENPEGQARCVEVVEGVLGRAGIPLLCWRDVPLGTESLGEKARASCPLIRQVLMARPPGFPAPAFGRRLYLARRQIERRVEADGLGPFYVPSFSHRTLVYKGLVVAPHLDRFYPDLADPDYRTAIAVFHQRYSTNTLPSWLLAQPFRFLAHNGEINTLRGNVRWMAAREPELRSELWGEDAAELLPVIQRGGSDSAALDNVFELLVMSGRDPLHAMMMLAPEACRGGPEQDPDLHAFYEYHATLMEPWDGPAALTFSDGPSHGSMSVAAALDRNGLRPLRYCLTAGGTVVVGSEAGIVSVPEDQVVEKGRLGPGKMLAVDTYEHRLLGDEAIKRSRASRRPYRLWLGRRMSRPPAPGAGGGGGPGFRARAEALVHIQKVFGYGAEDVERVLAPMMEEGKEPVGSMGDDTPLAVFSQKPQLLYAYFKQGFAQVTNPPIDPLREGLVMSLHTAVGARASVLEEREEAARLIRFPSPIITAAELEWLESLHDPPFCSSTRPTCFPVGAGPEGLEPALERLCEEAGRAVDGGCSLLILSDRGVGPDWAPIPMLLATAAVHHHLIRAGKRMRVSLICDTGEPREDHHYACLIGYGAALIHPYLAFASVSARAAGGAEGDGASASRWLGNYRAAVEKGILKVMSKMGISTVSSYRGAQVFEALGVSRRVIDRYFTHTPSRVGGVGLREIAADVLRFHAEAYGEVPELRERGTYRHRGGGEYHVSNPAVFKALHKAVRARSWEAYQEYARLVDQRPACALRDLLGWERAPRPVPLGEVEPAEQIARRFCTQAMSHGAIGRETHELLAVAMNRLGGKSNSGEGGEDPVRFRPYTRDMPGESLAPWHLKAGDWANSAIKQVASGRFGVTPEYLVSARELEIKMAQGSKPGEGGQIPGHKVTAEIARIRRSSPGVSLISPPPHHDIYSIEDLAQLIYDLKRVNGLARVCVKLVSSAGVGLVAAGVVKGHADCVQISGHDGGTGASPLSSIRNAGVPWELGLAETQQVLVRNDLRGRVTLRVDGGLKTGRDVVLAALLGAEEFGFGTAALLAAGCVMARRCHLNNCPVGIATQREDLRRKFPGQPGHVIAFMLYVAEQVRLILAEMGFRALAEVIGRTDLLRPRKDVLLPKTAEVDLSAVLADPDPSGSRPRRCRQPRNDRPEEAPPLDEVVREDYLSAARSGRPMTRRYAINNRERSVGARLAGEIAWQTGGQGLPEGTLTLHFRGCAGQSFGAFCERGMRLDLEGEAQDYVGKGMHGGEIVVRPPAGSRFAGHENVIVGNTVLYGATGGSLYAAGKAGERLCVRNSGACAVVEGCGDHGCEYMTAGGVVVLGETGRNFGAGMSGGVAYVLDPGDRFPGRYNPGMVSIERVGSAPDDVDLPNLIERHRERTGSARAAWVLERWDELLPKFWKVVPHPALPEQPTPRETAHAGG